MIHRDTHKWLNVSKIKSISTSFYFIVHQVVLIGVSYHCVKKTNCILYPHEYLFIFKSYGLDSIYCTGVVRVMGYKSLLSATHYFTSLLVLMCGVGGGGGGNGRHNHGPNPNKGGRGGLKEEGGERGLILVGVGCRGYVQVGIGDNSMITYIIYKCPSYTVLCLFEFLFSAFLIACILSFGVIMISNYLCPLMFSHHCFRRPKMLFSLAWIIGNVVGST